MFGRDKLIAYAIKYEGDWLKIYNALSTREEIESEYELKIQSMKCKTLTMLDDDYPFHLKQVHRPPFVLFYYGDISLIKNYYKNVSIVGSRKYSDYGKEMTEKIVAGLANDDYVIISGLALGIDAIAHTAAINSGMKTVAILGCGVDICYLLDNQSLYEQIKDNYLVMSEYPEGVQPAPYNFPIRNRIIAGLSHTVIITEAHKHSGSMITGLLAAEGNADVMCVPYPADADSGCNVLIKLGAYLVESPEDVIEQMTHF